MGLGTRMFTWSGHACVCSISMKLSSKMAKKVSNFTPRQLTGIHNRGRPTLKDVRQFRNGMVRGFIERVNHSTIEFIVKLYRELIVNFISNYLILSNDIYTNNDKNISGCPTAKPMEDLDDIDDCRSLLCYKPPPL